VHLLAQYGFAGFRLLDFRFEFFVFDLFIGEFRCQLGECIPKLANTPPLGEYITL